MPTIDHLPFALAVVGSALGLVLGAAELAALGLGAGYFLGKLVQSVVWTVGRPRGAP